MSEQAGEIEDLEKLKPLTPEQVAASEMFIAGSGLEEYADEVISFPSSEGIKRGTVRYGLGRSSKHIEDLTPSEVREWVLKLVEAQRQPPSS